MKVRKRILVVEDEAITAMDLRETLSLLGFDVGRIVATGEDAIRAAAESKFDLVLSDIVLRGPMDGIQAAGEISRNHGVPVVFLTAYGDWSTLSRARDAEPYGYLIKPFHAEALRATVETALLRADSQRQLKEREAELRSLSSSLIAAREEERTKLARELHDDLGQSLTLLRLQFSWTRDHPQMAAAELARRQGDATQIVDELISSVRRIVSGLRPPVLDDVGLTQALEWQCLEFTKRTGTVTHFDAKFATERGCEAKLPADTVTALFRILQEALTNVTRHAEASDVFVEIGDDDDSVYLGIRDNGVGLGSSQRDYSTSHGLAGIRERAASTGGTVEFKVPANGTGTELVVRIPTPSQSRAAAT